MINTAFLRPRNLLVIGAIVVAWHIVLSPVFKAVGSNPSSNKTATGAK